MCCLDIYYYCNVNNNEKFRFIYTDKFILKLLIESDSDMLIIAVISSDDVCPDGVYINSFLSRYHSFDEKFFILYYEYLYSQL